MQSKSTLKVPSMLNLGAILPGQYGEAVLPLEANEVCFLNIELSAKSSQAGFFLVKEGENNGKTAISTVLKPGKTLKIIVCSYPKEVKQSATFVGEISLKEDTVVHTIKIAYRVEIPTLFCKKMLCDSVSKQKIVRLILNKAVTSDTRISLVNQEDYDLSLQAELLKKQSIANKDCPFILNVNSSSINVQAGEQFFIPLTVSTNIGYKKEFIGLKKVIFRNVVTLKTNSLLIWCIPVQIIVVFVKQPESKE